MVMLSNSFIVVILFISASAAFSNNNELNKLNEPTIGKKWWQTASFYQIYPRSFKDSDGDGIGDLRGITESLEYLKEIGITATWLSPIFASPMDDFGYDISNFTKIEPLFGTIDDFDALIAKANQVGVKIILDFVPNHSSDECEWFQKSVARDPEFEDFYIWHPGKIVNGVRHPPTNWLSLFRFSAWTWNEQRQEYYLHQFAKKQPDLNFRNPKVKQYMKEILRYWLSKGIAGFRIDSVPYLFEIAADSDGNYLDEPRQDWVTDPDDYDYVNHQYTSNQPETIELIYEWRQILTDYKAKHGGDDRIILSEAYTQVNFVMRLYGNETTEGAQIPFNFLLINNLDKNSDAYKYAEIMNTWMTRMPEGRTPNWVMGNHDNSRIGSRMGTDRIDIWNMILLTLPGCSITYQGEEIGMTDVRFSWAETVDTAACNTNPTDYETVTRDPCRSPFQWSADKNAGFTNGPTTWLRVSDLYPMVNVEIERGIQNSHLNIYKQLQALRSKATFTNGDAVVKAINKNVLAIKRSLSGDFTYIILLNIMDNVEDINLNSVFSDLPTEFEYTVTSEKSVRKQGDKTYADTIVLLPKEAVVLRSSSKSSANRLAAYSLLLLHAILFLIMRM